MFQNPVSEMFRVAPPSDRVLREQSLGSEIPLKRFVISREAMVGLNASDDGDPAQISYIDVIGSLCSSWTHDEAYQNLM